MGLVYGAGYTPKLTQYMRPRLPETLYERLDYELESGKKLYKVAGYSSKKNVVEQALRDKVDEIEDQYK